NQEAKLVLADDTLPYWDVGKVGRCGLCFYSFILFIPYFTFFILWFGYLVICCIFLQICFWLYEFIALANREIWF
ncbi:hypothetical protein, partial [uncultured Campylobacter sp.]|uniref:hypothetical protein n=1 Tax=uncultured Campylobacter sp. TaxID=218934 RepID=UPI00262A7D90